MNLSKNSILPFIVFLFSVSCNQMSGEFEYIPLDSFRNEKVDLEDGINVRLLAFSGAVKSEHNKVYYSQLLVTIENTSDTIIILSPMVSYTKSDTDSSKIYSPIFSFNPPSDLLTASYHQLDSMQLKMLVHAETLSVDKTASFQEVEEKLKNGGIQQMVIVYKKMPEFAGGKYPATVGVLHFKKSPLKG